MLNKNLLRAVARSYGLQCSYKNVEGRMTWSPEKTLIKMIEDLSKSKINSELDLKKLYTKKRVQLFENKIKPCHVFWNGESSKIQICSDKELENKITAEVKFESGVCDKIEADVLSSRKTDLGFKSIIKINSKLPIGYHELSFFINDKSVTTYLICPPEKLEVQNKKAWGPFVPLYALRSESDWGIGSFKEAAELAQTLKPSGAKWMGLLPMLASNFDYPDCDPSPYSSLSRLFWNEIYLDVDLLVEKYNDENAKKAMSSTAFKEKLESLRSTTHVDYYNVYQAKKEILIMLSDVFFEKQLHKEIEYKKFEEENPDINHYSEFRSKEIRQQNFHKFVQFEMNNTLKDFSKKNDFGLYMDYPVGVNDGGFDFKEFRNVFYGEVSVGAPPEPVFALGQDWGFPAFHPAGMQADKYKYFKKSIKHHLKFCKILRLDHIMGLHRIYSVPKNFKGNEGVYLRFPPEELFAVVILEAHLAGADLIGENLGTVPEAVEKIIRQRHLNGMWVLQCETWRNPEAAFAAIPKNSLVCVNTHDMPMLNSYKKGSDLDLVESLNILSSEYKNKFKKERLQQIENWEDSLGEKTFTARALENISKSHAKYFVVNLEDFWGEEMPQNIPGTWKEYPNWRKKFLFKTQDWKNNIDTKQSLKALNKERPSDN